MSQALRWADRPELFIGTAPTIEGVTVAEYERRVNEILLLAFRLRGRRSSRA